MPYNNWESYRCYYCIFMEKDNGFAVPDKVHANGEAKIEIKAGVIEIAVKVKYLRPPNLFDRTPNCYTLWLISNKETPLWFYLGVLSVNQLGSGESYCRLKTNDLISSGLTLEKLSQIVVSFQSVQNLDKPGELIPLYGTLQGIASPIHNRDELPENQVQLAQIKETHQDSCRNSRENSGNKELLNLLSQIDPGKMPFPITITPKGAWPFRKSTKAGKDN